MKIIAVCGAQGALFHKLKKHVVANVEPRAVFHTPKEEQWKANFEDIPFYRNLSQLSKNMKEDVDLIVGSPSCGHSSAFSYSRKKTLGKPKEDPTLNLFISSIQDIQPQMFVMENLPKLMDFIPQDEWEATFPEYNFKILCHSVSMFGNSQVSRKRLLLIGIKKSSKINKIPFEIFTTKKIKHCKELYKSLRQELNFKEDDTKTVSMYFYSDKTKRSLQVKEVEALWKGKFKKHYRWPMKGHRMNTLPGVYRNRWNAYPLTLRPSNRQFNPSGAIMGLEEYRIIMGFPKSYRVYFDSTNKTYWLNKARTALTKGATYEMGLWLFKTFRAHNLI